MSWGRVHPLDELKVQQRIRYRPHGRKARVGEGRIRAITTHGAIVRTGHTSAGTELLAFVTLEQIEAVWIRPLRESATEANDLTGFPPLAG